MRRRSCLLAVSSLAAFATLASAADLPLPPDLTPEPPPLRKTLTWSGFYVGGQIGYSVGNDITREFLTNPWTFVGLQNRFEPTGWVGGVHAGANLQMGNFVAGLEGDAEYGKVNGGFVDPPAPPFNPGGSGRTELGWQGSIRGRLGYAFGRLLIYGTGGLAVGELTSTYANWAGTSEAFKRTVYGYTLGGGLEYALTDAITVRGEYRYTDYRLIKNHSQVAFPGFSGTQEPYYSTVRAGMSYKF